MKNPHQLLMRIFFKRLFFCNNLQIKSYLASFISANHLSTKRLPSSLEPAF